MTSLPHGLCPFCGVDVALRRGGLVREHEVPGGVNVRGLCPGSGKRAPDPEPVEHERRVVGIHPVLAHGHQHIGGVELVDGSQVEAADVIAAIKAGGHVHYTMIPPEGAPARAAYEKFWRPLILQVRQCPDCTDEVLFA